MKGNVRIRVIAILVLLIMLSAFTVKIIAEDTDQIPLPGVLSELYDNDNEVYKLGHSTFQNYPIYCINSDGEYNDGGNYTIKEYSKVEPYTIESFIFTLLHDYKNPNEDATNWFGIKQRLIWYYMDDGSRKGNGDEFETANKKINELYGSQIGYDVLKNTNAKINEYASKVKDETDVEKSSYEWQIDAFKILKVDKIGDNIKVAWKKLDLATGYEVYINDNEKYEKGTIKEEHTDNYDYYIEIPISDFTGAKAQIKVKAKNAGIKKAGYYRLTKGSGQDVIVPVIEYEDVEAEDETIELNTDVSLQKYITKVNDNDLTSNETALRDRKNTYTSADEVEELAKKVVSKKEENSMKAENYKKANIVNIEVGDTVTYRIHVYNNSSVVAKSVVVRDYLDNTNNCEIVKITRDGGNEDIKASLQGTDNPRIKQYTIENLAGGADTYFDVTIKYTEYVANIVTNTAWIFSTDPITKTTYRTLDRDYVKMKEYKISLEKFVESVKSNGNYVGSYGGTRAGKRYNDEASTDENKNTYKPQNIVQVEPGDIVTYIIRLKNTGNTEVKIHQIYDKFDVNSNGVKLEYHGIDNGNGGGVIESHDYKESGNSWQEDNYNAYLIKFNNPTLLKAGDRTDVKISFKVDVPADLTRNSYTFKNIACITGFKNKNNVELPLPNADSDGIDNNRDQDFVQTKTYAVSLEKFVYKVNNYELYDFDNNGSVNINDADLLNEYINKKSLGNSVKEKIKRYGDLDGNGIINVEDYQRFRIYLREEENSNITREGRAEHNYDDDTRTDNPWKYNHVVTVSRGDTVTYKIKLMNDGQTDVYITKVTDFFPNGVTFKNRTFSGSQYDVKEVVDENGVEFSGNDIKAEIILEHGKSKEFKVTVTVNESNSSINILKNTAEITEMQNRNNVTVTDTTPNNNKDSDYLQLNYPGNTVILSGFVWEDKNQAKDGGQYGYDALHNSNEDKLQGIVVKLFRRGINSPIATKRTDVNGHYSFAEEDIDPSVVTEEYQRYLKGPMVSSDITRWAGTYYLYHIVFEYDGIKYTSTPDGKSYVNITDSVAHNNEKYMINSNAKENLDTRKAFNNKFNPINNTSLNDSQKLDYTTKNESGFIPQSIYNKKSFMTMISSTNEIQLANESAIENEFKYINLGLRGRDIFDLELISDVARIDMSVNGVHQTYEYTNRLTVRKSDLNANTNILEDMANISLETQPKNTYIGRKEQDVRNSDTSYVNSIYVTYKITVQNTSKTNGTATKIINYYDNAYRFNRAYSGNTSLNASNSNGGNGYKSVIITTPQTNLTQSETMDIYVEYELENLSALQSLGDNDRLATYNMSEIYEYKTFAKNDDNEYVRGLIDKDSAPGSVATEKARLTEGSSNLSTVDYYFNKQGLNKLKYEDDTYAIPTYYLVINVNARILTGYVFEDHATVNNDNIKSGNGKFMDSNDKPVFGADVELTIPVNGGNTKTFNAKTNENGKFTITGFIPGEGAKLVYKYGNRADTVVIGEINKESYNGADFQSTKNTGLNTEGDFWYIKNGNNGKANAISIADENATRRNAVSTNVANSEELRVLLNKARAGQTLNDSEKTEIFEKTQMYAEVVKPFTLTVEEADENGAKVKYDGIKDYIVPNMNFGISKVPVTTVNLRTAVKEFIITDAAGDNTIASAKRKYVEEGGKTVEKWDVVGNVLAPGYDSNVVNTVDTAEMTKMLDVSIEEEKKQGAKLKIIYEVSVDQKIEKDFKGTRKTGETGVVINGLVDYVDNDLSYSSDSMIDKNTKNSDYWEVTTYDATQTAFRNAIKEATGVDADANKAYGSVNSEDRENGLTDPEAKKHTTILKLKDNVGLLNKANYKSATDIYGNNIQTASCDLVLQKVLSAQDNTLSNIVTSTVETSEYENKVEITGLNYENTKVGDFINADRIRTPNTIGQMTQQEFNALNNETKNNLVQTSWMTIIPGEAIGHNLAESSTLSQHPPTGDSIEHNNTVYYIIAIASLAVLAGGVVLIKKIVVNKD